MSSGVPANEIERESFVNDQVGSLIVEELPFNKCQQEFMQIKSSGSLW
jgi:hypothetical protein